jgi:nucleoside-diphosphate-sugar epimerase
MSEVEQPKQKKVLVTGATGFIGREIVRACLTDGFDVVPTGNSEGQEGGWSNYVRADLTVPNALSSALSGVDCVVHSAGLAHQFKMPKADESFRKINADAVEYVARSAAQASVRHFVLISSVAVYGENAKNNPNEESPCNPRGEYATSKLEGEKRAVEVCESAKMRLTVLRPATVYGEGDKGNVARLIRMIESGRFVFVGDGSNQKCLIHVSDVARACLAVIKSKGEGVGIYNVSSEPRAMREIVEGIAQELDQRPPRMFIPSWLVTTPLKVAAKLTHGFGPLKTTIEKWLSDDIFDGSKFEKDFNFQPTVSLKEGLKREVNWFKRDKEQ